MCRHAAIDLDEATYTPCHAASGPEPMYKPNHKGKRHPKPARFRKQDKPHPRRIAARVLSMNALDVAELSVIEQNRMQCAALGGAA